MAPPFSRNEYADRLNRVLTAMQMQEMDVLVIGDPANINWLTGYDAWSFYTPQIMVVGLEVDPTWIGREMDAPKPGNYFTFKIADSLIFVIRDEKKNLRSYANICRHRLARLLKDKGNVKAIVCPYHAWIYNLGWW